MVNSVENKEHPTAEVEATLSTKESDQCPSCGGLNTSCPEGCGRDPITGELNGTTYRKESDLSAENERLESDWFDKAIRDHANEHGPSGGAWNISMVLERLHRARQALTTEQGSTAALQSAAPVEDDVRTCASLAVEFSRWLDEGPNAQPSYKSGLRPFSTGDLKAYVAAITALIERLSSTGEQRNGST